MAGQRAGGPEPRHACLPPPCVCAGSPGPASPPYRPSRLHLGAWRPAASTPSAAAVDGLHPRPQALPQACLPAARERAVPGKNTCL